MESAMDHVVIESMEQMSRRFRYILSFWRSNTIRNFMRTQKVSALRTQVVPFTNALIKMHFEQYLSQKPLDLTSFVSVGTGEQKN